MKLGFRWYGQSDKVKLDYIRQIPNMKGIISALYSVPVGDVWPKKDIQELRNEIENKHLRLEVIESVPIHEDIKLGLETKDEWIKNYQQTIRNLAEEGVKVICYNFMPIFDWTRTTLDFLNKDGSSSLALDEKELEKLDPLNQSLSLPGWDESYEYEALKELMNQYESVDEEKLWENLTYFLQKILPVAEEVGIKMAIHPDDPPYSIFGLPRIIKNKKSYKRLFKISTSPSNGITFCTGSLGVGKENNIYEMLDEYLSMGKVHFMHVRNIQVHKNTSFEETAHASNYGSIDMIKIMSLLKKYHYSGYMRPDHGRMIFGEKGRPGYGLYDRSLGTSYLYGIWETLNYPDVIN
ncbi:mannonate dehydratase [Marinilactibacillus sp. GCM10026970]|uniref:mannonate dehydratase n=1 Tax=Marinilactibacillus sp. GCM10026970 TaxID=3252642 RepID=UPI0036170101